MKNLKKLSRIELKEVGGGVGFEQDPFTADAGNCWVYERNSLQGNAGDYVGGGSGTCKNPPSGYHCKTYTAMGSC